MKIELNRIKIRDVVADYRDYGVEGVTAYGGRLDVRPKYQREFVYKGEQRDAVIKTVTQNFPLNVMYWMVKDDGSYEVLDGQQRTISICRYVTGEFSINARGFKNLTQTEQEQILDYELMIYFCEGNDKERLDWFMTINIAGEKLTDQEIRNAVYAGSWLSRAKRTFSKHGCVAYLLANEYNQPLLKGTPIRQEYLETALAWINHGQVAEYMAKHQHDENADELWEHFERVIRWARSVFTNYRKEMAGVNWGELYHQFKDKKLNTDKLETEIATLMQDEDVTKKSGIYPYVLTRQEKHLSIRAFNDKLKREAYERQKGVCARCGEQRVLAMMEADHITPWHEGGPTTAENCQMLCKDCNRRKGGR